MNEEEFFESVAVIDHRSENKEVIEDLRSSLKIPFEYELSADICTLITRDEKHRIPLTGTRHDKYIVISSIAEIFVQEYSFYISDNSLEDDTHYIKVFSANEKRPEIRIWEYTFIPMEMGYDYFNGIDIPYFGHEDNNLDFEWEVKQVNEGLNLIRPVLVKEKLRQLKEGVTPEPVEEVRDDPSMGKFGRELRIKVGTASGKDKFIYYGSRYWWLLFLSAWLYWWQV